MDIPLNIIQESFVGSSFALLTAFLIWLIKSSYEKYGKEIMAIAKIERSSVINLSVLESNIFLIKQWIDALKQKRSYSCAFGDLIIDNESHFSVSDLGLANRVLKNNFLNKEINEDLNNIYNDYRKIVLGIAEDRFKVSDEGWEFYNKNLLDMLQKILNKMPEINNDIIKTIAYSRRSGRVKFHSLFGYLTILRRTVFPVVTKKSLEKEMKKIKEEIEIKK